jgi:hypothetical protein
MRILSGLSALLLVSLFAGPAEARKGDWLDWVITPKPANFSRPYLDGAKTLRGTPWLQDDWNPEEWVEARGSKEEVLNGLYRANIITDDIDVGDSVLEVGYNFMRLPSKDQKHVVQFVDYVTGATNSQSGQLMIERDSGRWSMRDIPIGIYSAKYGLQLQ